MGPALRQQGVGKVVQSPKDVMTELPPPPQTPLRSYYGIVLYYSIELLCEMFTVGRVLRSEEYVPVKGRSRGKRHREMIKAERKEIKKYYKEKKK